MGDLTAAEANGYLNLIAVLQEADRHLRLGVHIVFFDGGRQLHFLDIDNALIFPVLPLPLCLFVAVLVIIQQFTYRRNS